MNDDDNAYQAWRQAQTDNGTIPGGAMRLDPSTDYTEAELDTFRRWLPDYLPPTTVGLVADLIRQKMGK
jgi:hypothetical protein